MGGNGHRGKKGSRKREGRSAECTSPSPATFWPFPAEVTHPLQHQDCISSFEFLSPQVQRTIKEETEAREGQYRYHITLSPGARRKLGADSR